MTELLDLGCCTEELDATEELDLTEELDCCCWLLEDCVELLGVWALVKVTVNTKENFWPSIVISSVAFSVVQ